MSARLRYTVYVPREDGSTAAFGPGDEVPGWARKLITNPIAWEVAPDSEEDGDDSESKVVIPAGEPDDSWKSAELKAYAAAHDIALGKATRKADILEVLHAAAPAKAAADPGDGAADDTSAASEDGDETAAVPADDSAADGDAGLPAVY